MSFTCYERKITDFKWFLVVIITITILLFLMVPPPKVAYFYPDIFVHSMNFIMGKKQQFVSEQLNFDLQVTSWYFLPLKKLLIWWVKCQGKNSHHILNRANLISLNINDILTFDFFLKSVLLKKKDIRILKEYIHLGILYLGTHHLV